MNTCGGCKQYGNNSCYSTKAAFSLLDDVFADTPACEHFEHKPAAEPDCVRTEPQAPSIGLSMLSRETLDKLDPSDSGVRIALRAMALAPEPPRLTRMRDWHRDADK